MLEGAMRELAIGDPAPPCHRHRPRDRRGSAQRAARARRARCARRGSPWSRCRCRPSARAARSSRRRSWTWAASRGLAHLTREVFGPVLHVRALEARRAAPRSSTAINATGYGLTHGIHTRIDETVAAILARVRAGNVYVNRNIVGAVVGVQPFGGHGLSGTGPKAGGPLYLRRLVRGVSAPAPEAADRAARVRPAKRTRSNSIRAASSRALPPTRTRSSRRRSAALALGNTVLLLRDRGCRCASASASAARGSRSPTSSILPRSTPCSSTSIATTRAACAACSRPRPAGSSRSWFPMRHGKYDWTRLVVERTVTVNTSAAGGNAALLSLAKTRPSGVGRRVGHHPERRRMRYFDAATIRALLPWPRMLAALDAMLKTRRRRAAARRLIRSTCPASRRRRCC